MIKGFKQVNVYVEGIGIVKKTIRIENGKTVRYNKDWGYTYI